MVLDNLRKAGVQNTFKDERLSSTARALRRARGSRPRASSPTADGETVRVAVSIGPEYGTVGPDQIKEAAKEAVRGAGFDLLLVCGFAFDAGVGRRPAAERRLRRAQVRQPAGPARRMNPDLVMGDDLLKKTGAGNLFMVFGEPDVEITDVRTADGSSVESSVEVHGLDVYDPTDRRGPLPSTDDIACWFIDTDYDGKSFFVRHAYFTGGDEPYECLNAPSTPRSTRSLGHPLLAPISRRSPAVDRQDRSQGHQPLRRRGAQGLRRQRSGRDLTMSTRTCPSGHPNPEEQRFCGECGAPMQPPVPPQVDGRRLRSVPPSSKHRQPGRLTEARPMFHPQSLAAGRAGVGRFLEVPPCRSSPSQAEPSSRSPHCKATAPRISTSTAISEANLDGEYASDRAAVIQGEAFCEEANTHGRARAAVEAEQIAVEHLCALSGRTTSELLSTITVDGYLRGRRHRRVLPVSDDGDSCEGEGGYGDINASTSSDRDRHRRRCPQPNGSRIRERRRWQLPLRVRVRDHRGRGRLHRGGRRQRRDLEHLRGA